MRNTRSTLLVTLACAGLLLAVPGLLEARQFGPPTRVNWCGNQATQPICNGAQCSSCAQAGCHAMPGEENAGQGSVTILDTGSGMPVDQVQYTPGSQLALQVILEDINNPVFAGGGFEVSVVRASDFCQNISAPTPVSGVLEIAEPGTTQIIEDGLADVQFLTHDGRKPAAVGVVMWDLIWNTPQNAGEGDMVFNICANAANGNDFQDAGDSIYCAEFTVAEDTGGGQCAGQPDGTACDDGITCTAPDQCFLEICRPGLPDDNLCPAGFTCDPGDPNANADGCVAPPGTEDCTTPEDEDGEGDGGTCPDTDCPEGTPCVPDQWSCTDDLCVLDALGVTCRGVNNDANCDQAAGETCNPGDPNADPVTGCVAPASTEDCTTPEDEDGEGDGGTCPDTDCAAGVPCIPDAFTCTDDLCVDNGGTVNCENVTNDANCAAGETCNPADPNADPTTGCVVPAPAEDCSTDADEDGDGEEGNAGGVACGDSDCWCDFDNCADSDVADCDGDFVSNVADCAAQDTALWAPAVETFFIPSPLGGGLASAHSIIKITQRDPGNPQGDFFLFAWANQQTTVGQSTVFDLVSGNAADLGSDPEPFQNAICFQDAAGGTVNDLVPFGLAPFSAPGEICGNGTDDEPDGLTDCFDPECLGTASCPESAVPQGCNDLLDNDGDFGVLCPNCGIDCPIIDFSGPTPVLLAGDLDCLAAPECNDIYLPINVTRKGGGETFVEYFLPRGENTCDPPGTYGDGTDTPDPRDFLDANSPCPR